MSIEKHLERIAISLEKISFLLEENHDRMSKMNDDSSFTQQQTKIHTNIETNIENIEEHNHSKIYDFLKNLGITVKCLPPSVNSSGLSSLFSMKVLSLDEFENYIQYILAKNLDILDISDNTK